MESFSNGISLSSNEQALRGGGPKGLSGGAHLRKRGGNEALPAAKAPTPLRRAFANDAGAGNRGRLHRRLGLPQQGLRLGGARLMELPLRRAAGGHSGAAAGEVLRQQAGHL